LKAYWVTSTLFRRSRRERLQVKLCSSKVCETHLVAEICHHFDTMALRLKFNVTQNTTVSCLEKYVDSPRFPKIPEESEEDIATDSTNNITAHEVDIDYSKILLEDIVFSDTQSLQFVHDLETKKTVAVNFVISKDQIIKIIDFVSGRAENYINIGTVLSSNEPQPHQPLVDGQRLQSQSKSEAMSVIGSQANNNKNYESNPANDPTFGCHAGNCPTSQEVFMLNYRKAGLSQFSAWALTTIEPLSDAVLESEEYLDRLFECLFVSPSFLDDISTQGKDWAKVVEFFMCKHTKCPRVVSYLFSPKNSISHKDIFHGLLNKIGNENICKLFLELLTGDTSLIDWDELLSKEPHNFVSLVATKIQQIVSLTPTEYTYWRQLELSNLIELMNALVKKGTQSRCGALLQTKDFLQPLLDLVFRETPHFAAIVLLQFVNCVLGASTNSEHYNTEKYPAIISLFLDESQRSSYLSRLPRLIAIEPQLYSAFDESLHFSSRQFRLALIECANRLYQSNYAAVHKKLTEEKLLNLLFDLFFKHKRNNILHSAVQRLFFDFVYCEDTSLLTTFVAEYKFLDKLVDEFEDHMEKLRKIETPNIKPPQNTRFEKVMIEERQYLGHVFLIADKLRKVAALIPELYHLIDNHLRWKELTDGIWSEMQELQKRKMC